MGYNYKNIKVAVKLFSIKKGVFKNFVNFTGKHLPQSFLFDKVVDLRPATLLKKRLWHICFQIKFAKLFRKFFLYNTSERLLLIPSKLPQLLLLIFLAKFLKERKYPMHTLIFVRQNYL